jgi:hypothetical protein
MRGEGMADGIHHLLALTEVEGPFAVCKLDKDAVIPAWATGDHSLSVGFNDPTRTRIKYTMRAGAGRLVDPR